MENDGPDDICSWHDLAYRLKQYATAVSALGGMNDLDKTLLMAESGINLLIEKVPGCGFYSEKGGSHGK